MRISFQLKRAVVPVLLLFGLGAFQQAQAASYASGLSNNAGVISFVLNEPASNVKIVWNSGANTNDLGALPKGVSTTANLGVTGVYKVVVNSSLPTGYTQTSVDTNNTSKYNSPRGVTVNANPASPYFGRIYVANSAAGTASSRAVGDGIYVMKADQSDALGQGNTALTGGIPFTASTSNAWKIAFGKDDDLLYINNFASVDCNVWAVDGNLSGTVGTNVLQGLGLTAGAGIHADAASTPIIRGSIASNNLVLINVDGSASGHFNEIARWDIGAGPLPWANAPSYLAFCDRSPGNLGVAGLSTDVDLGPDGKYYTSIFRSANDTASMKVYDTDGTTVLWNSLTTSQGMGSVNDLPRTRAFALSYDNSQIATLHDNNSITVMKLKNGLPDLSSRFIITNGIATISGRDIAFDAAGNIYTVSSGQALLRVQSVGGPRIATTTSDGIFTIFNPFPSVSVSATDNLASETGPDSATFTISRTGDLSLPLDVNYTFSGTALNGSDYTNLTGTTHFSADVSSAEIVVSPIDDSIPEFTETVILTLTSNANYNVELPGNAIVSIIDNENPELTISAVQPTAYEGTPGDYITFQVTRKGDTNVDLTANIIYSGTATADVDYNNQVSTVNLPAGVVNQTFKLNTINNSNLQTPNLTIIASLDPGTGYDIGTNSSATGTIIDDELEAETVLFADPLSSDTSANWTTLFGANNLIDDKLVAFGIDLNSEGTGVPAAPNGLTSVLKLTVNKGQTNAGGAAGLSLYPKGQSFKGDFAVRFDMYLQQNNITGTTEFATFGINHSGTKTNWNRQSAAVAANVGGLPKDSDGLWFSVISDASASAPGDYALFTGTNPTNPPTLVKTAVATAFSGIFKNPPFTPAGLSGAPANIFNSPTKVWVNVEVKQVGGVVTMSINKTPILTYTNATAYANGNIMLGYMDPYDSVGSTNGAVYYSNLRVVNLRLTISSIQSSDNSVVINFIGSSPTDTINSFTVQGSSTLSSSGANYTSEAGASIIQLSPGFFQATVPKTMDTRFYRIKR